MIINLDNLVKYIGIWDYRMKSGKQTIKYSKLKGRTARTKKVQTGSGFFWTSNEEEVARYLAHEGVRTVMTEIYSADKDKQKAYNLAKQVLHDYLAAMIYRMFKLHGNAIINSNDLKKLENSLKNAHNKGLTTKIAEISNLIQKFKYIKLKKVFELPVKHNGKFDYGRKLYEKTNTSKQQSSTKDIIKFIAITELLKFLNTDTYTITTLENLQNTLCKPNRYQNTPSETEKYIKPTLYKTDNTSTTPNALFGVCNGDQLSSINVQNIIYSYVLSVKQIIAGINNKDYRNTDVYKKAKGLFEETTKLLKNRVNIEQMASALFYYSMYVANNTSQQQNAGGYVYGGYHGGYHGGYGYPRW